uniref:glycine--tRNA ligase n=1 Tax=Chenopodium quinoa TaxID=63459 RepID=A0A803M9K5_CHEQI
MGILTLPLVISVLKPHNYKPQNFSFILHPTRHFCFKPHNRRFFASSSSAASTLQHNFSDNGDPSSAPCTASVPTFQQAIQRLQEYWASVGCAVMQCSNTEVGAGTMNPLTYLRVLGPEPWNVAYVEPSIRPDDSRYGENPNRLQRHTQFQVILKPDPGNSQDLFIRSLSALGVNVNDHDIRFVEDNWESPVLGAWGLGWEVWMDGMEITQFTYFQQAGGLPLLPVSVEITYGLERILMLLQEVDHFKKIQYADGITYGELFSENEKEMSAYYLEHATVDHIQKHFDFFEKEARHLLELGLPIPAYDQLLKTSHAFNILDSRGFVGVTERARYFGRMRSLARECAQLWLKTRESLGHPLGISAELGPITCPSEVIQSAVEKIFLAVQQLAWLEPRMFALEIGTEELPSQDVSYATQQLKDLIVQLLEKQRLGHHEVQAFGTPRRLVVCIDGLCARQAENEVEVRGPPASKAFDSQGNPTKAVEGFCRRYNTSLDSIYKKVDGKTQYIYARVTEPSRFALEVLAEGLPGTIAKLSFPKSMRWNSQVLFSRPIRWIMALHGDVIIPFTFAGVSSGNLSYGLRNTPFATVKVESAESYTVVMKNAGISVDIEERKNVIVEHSTALADTVNGQVIMPNGLLDEVVNLIEAPTPLLGNFDESFLMLPKDLLTMVMQKHQKYFGIADKSGRLLPYFIAVANGDINVDVVRKGNEAVIRARYEDAKFFYETDSRKKLSEFRGQLNGILFQEKLGTMLDKMMRVEIIVTKLASSMGFQSEQLQNIQEAASLAMSDLSTAVVTEFTSLAGIMARHYAYRDGYSEQIAEALYEITLPKHSGDILPKTDAGNVLAIADRLDSLVGLFGAGCQPSSTNDPFGLRRISYGLVQLLVENNKDLNFRHSLELAAEVQPVKVDSSTIDDVQQFVTRRLEQYLVDRGINSEVVRSVLIERANWPCLAAKSAVKMEALFKEDLLPKVVEAYSRPTRIVRGKDLNDNTEVNEAVFETKEERALWTAFLSVNKQIYHGIEIDEFVNASSELVQPLADFFDNVFVMVEEEQVRNNRLALLKKIADLPRGIADLSSLPGF